MYGSLDGPLPNLASSPNNIYALDRIDPLSFSFIHIYINTISTLKSFKIDYFLLFRNMVLF